jgi:pimeloyl-ACP methyl ester carboxylesterase
MIDHPRGSLLDTARLHYWLGPWASGQTPSDDRVISRPVFGLPVGSRLYAPADRAPRGAFLISPGLHFDGPRDPRMDRLARIFATAGFIVLSPAVPDLMTLRLTPRVAGQVSHAFDVLLDAPELPAGCRPAVFSISVGSLAALRLAARPEVSQLIVFGGYADPAALIRSLTESPDEDRKTRATARDPLNAPAAFCTLFDHIGDAADAAELRDAWLGMVRATWPRSELKVPGGTLHVPIARAFAAELPKRLRRMFLIGCGALPGGWPLCEAALATGAYAYLDPRPHLGAIECPVTIVHGISDDVIPFAQAGELERALPAGVARPTLATGMLAHSNAVPLTGRAAAITRELVTFHRICRAISA